jgi:hypothetical protein
MARDSEDERDAEEWCDALIGDSSESLEKWFDKLDELNSEPFPTGHPHLPIPKCEVFE